MAGEGTARLQRALRSVARELKQRVGRLDRARPADVHRARVTARRLRSLIKVYRPCFKGATVKAYRRELGRVSDLLGELRAIDVLAQLPSFTSSEIQHRIQREREAASRRLRRRARSAANARALASATSTPTPRELGLRDELGMEDLVHRLCRAWCAVEKAIAGLHDSEEARHELRILLKRLRYSLEIIDDFAGRASAALIDSARAAQQLLGDWRDAVAGQAWLHAARTDLAPAVVASASRALRRRERELGAALAPTLAAVVESGQRWERAALRAVS